MYVVVGQSAALGYVMDEHLYDEISRGLWWFFAILLAGVAVCFITFSICFERRLQVRVTKPISKLSREIKNPKDFMSERQKSLENAYSKSSKSARSSTFARPNQRNDSEASTNTTDSDRLSSSADMISARNKSIDNN